MIEMVTSFRILELSGECSWKNLEVADNPKTITKKFLDWQIEYDKFDYAVLAVRDDGFFSKIMGCRNPFPSVCPSAKVARQQQDLLVEHMLRGFEVVLATKSSIEECCDFFEKFDYIQVADYMSDIDDSFLQSAWNRKEICSALNVAMKLGSFSFFCFAHDADPIYILCCNP